MNYLPLLRAERDSALRLGHRYTVVTDADDVQGFDVRRANLPEAVMPAMIAGVIERLRLGADSDLVFVDADCLIARDLSDAFIGEWDLGLTYRMHDIAPINNGVMYVRRAGIPKALAFFERAYTLCGEHWGADQEAISRAAAPVPQQACVEQRGGCSIAFLSTRTHAVVPKRPLKKHFADPFVIHFKGETKAWMVQYQRHYFRLES
jgi:hypothetical protein